MKSCMFALTRTAAPSTSPRASNEQTISFAETHVVYVAITSSNAQLVPGKKLLPTTRKATLEFAGITAGNTESTVTRSWYRKVRLLRE